MRIKHPAEVISVVITLISLSAGSVLAGPYSTGLINKTAGAPDAAIAGFVGPAGEGVTATATNGNYVNSIFKGWATSVVSYVTPAYLDISTYAGGAYSHPEKALGPVTGSNVDIVSLGDLYDPANPPKVGGVPVDPTDTTDKYAFIGYDDPGQVTLSFACGIRNGSGADFAVFENAFGSDTSMFAELAYVEVSSNGIDYARFPSVSLTPAAVGAYGNINPTNVYNLAGKHQNAYGKSWGTPFDLSDLLSDSLVTSGVVDINNIFYVRLVDIAGSGHFKDSLGNPIYDAWVTWGSGGLDLEAVGVINAVPEPGALIAMLSGLIGLSGLIVRRRMN